jgi:hypothetical protein
MPNADGEQRPKFMPSLNELYLKPRSSRRLLDWLVGILSDSIFVMFRISMKIRHRSDKNFRWLYYI